MANKVPVSQESSATSLTVFLNLLEQKPKFEFFRGQEDGNKPLIPKIARPGYSSQFKLKDLEFLLISDFKKFAKPYLDTEPRSEIEWFAIAQHFGLRTRLLDWTQNPITALYFAVNESDSKQDGAVWGILIRSENKVDHSVIFEDIDNLNLLSSYVSGWFNPRIVAQEACFSISPVVNNQIMPIDKKLDAVVDLWKIKIPGRYKAVIKSQLDSIGVNEFKLFPGLDNLTAKLHQKYYRKSK
ncbi:MAG: FRG domain-containing protein [Candidatus Neomarinimicrobiota bacterium]